MRSPRSKSARGDPDDSNHSVQDTLDAFEAEVGVQTAPRTSKVTAPGPEKVLDAPSRRARQSCIDAFLVAGAQPPGGSRVEAPSRAMEGIALEMAMERIALTEASTGIQRDELLLMMAREIQLPLARLDLVDGYITDLELEGKLRRVGDVVVLARPGDEDLLAMDLGEVEFLERYRRRHAQEGRGGAG